MRSKFHHEEIFRGKDLIKKISDLEILVCGVGALGSNLVDNLTRQGFSKIKVLDMDRVEIHNLNTQVWATTDIGALKVDAMKNKVFRNIGVEIETINRQLTAENASKLIRKCSLVIDCFDNPTARQILQDEARKSKIPCLHMGLDGSGSYGEIIWDEFYTVPRDNGVDGCDNPMSRNVILLTTTVATEEIVSYLGGVKHNWTITLKDMKITQI